MRWDKASYGGTTGKSGAGKLKSPSNEGDRGIPPRTGGIAKSSVSGIRGGIDSPGTKGDRGIRMAKRGGYKKSGPPLDD